MHLVVLALAAMLGTLTGLFVGIPIVGSLLGPITQRLCQRWEIKIDVSNELDPIMRVEGMLVCGLGMALGVSATVLLAGIILQAAGTALASVTAGSLAGLVFGIQWRGGLTRASATPSVVAAGLVGATGAVVAAWLST